MIATRNERPHTIPAARKAATPATGVAGVPLAHWGLAGVLLLFAYEWLLSGLDKLFSATFRSGLAANLKGATHDNPNQWYAHIITSAVLPHAAAFAIVVEAGELLVTGGLVAGAILWLTGHRLPARWASLLHLAVIAALLGSAVMTANYYLMAGNTWPWLKTADPFNEALDIDGLLTLIALALLAVQLVAWRSRRVSAGPIEDGAMWFAQARQDR